MSRSINVLCATELSSAQIARIEQSGPEILVEHPPIKDGSELEAALTPAIEVVFGNRGDWNPAVAPSVRWLQTTSAGINHLIGTPVWNSEIEITSANGVHAVQIGEYCLMTILAHCHHLPVLQRLQIAAVWANDAQRAQLMPTELRDATLGIIGYGAIGREVARLATSCGMRVLATQRSPGPQRFNGWTPAGTGDPDGTLPARYYQYEQLDQLLAESDAVLLAVPLAPTTERMIGAAQLAAMRPHALIINIGRGRLIDQPALVDALRDRRIGGAALDVTDPEPLPFDDPLWSLPGVMLTPHLAGMTPRYMDRAVDLFVANLQRYLRGEPLFNVVDRERGY